METTTETNKNNRELTATEIKIAIAQIEDRLTRVVKAMCHERSLCDGDPPIWMAMDEFSLKNDPSGELCGAYIKAEVHKYKSQLEIPEGVHLMDRCGMIMSDIPRFMIFAKWWIKGEMTDEIFDLFCFHYCEVVEVDYFWVLMDEVGNYYGAGLHKHIEERRDDGVNDDELDGRAGAGYVQLEAELRRIGTRSKKKARMNFEMNFGHD